MSVDQGWKYCKHETLNFKSLSWWKFRDFIDELESLATSQLDDAHQLNSSSNFRPIEATFSTHSHYHNPPPDTTAPLSFSQQFSYHDDDLHVFHIAPFHVWFDKATSRMLTIKIASRYHLMNVAVASLHKLKLHWDRSGWRKTADSETGLGDRVWGNIRRSLCITHISRAR